MASESGGGLHRPRETKLVPVSPAMVQAWRILLVEDDVLIGAILAETLTDMGHEVCAVATGETEAVAAAVHHRPDLMLVDVNLAEGNGIDAVRRILATGFIPHVFMSGDISRVRATGPNDVILRKPFKDADLGRVIDHAMKISPA